MAASFGVRRLSLKERVEYSCPARVTLPVRVFKAQEIINVFCLDKNFNTDFFYIPCK